MSVSGKTLKVCGLASCVCYLLLVRGPAAQAQLARAAQEVWPSVDVYYRLNANWRLYGTLAGTKLDESSYADGAFGMFVDYFTFPLVRKYQQRNHNDSLPGRYFWLRAGYQYSAAPPSSEDPFRENMVVTEANTRFYLPWQVMLTWKNRFDWRSSNGDFNGRYRPRLNIERDFRTDYLQFTAYAFGEYFLNFSQPNVNRFRTQVGLEIRVSKIINYEVFWNHQFANEPEVASVDAFGMTLKGYLSRKQKKRSKVPTS
jgi:hypothetical protein